MKNKFEKTITEQQDMLTEIRPLVGLKFVELVEKRMQEQQELIDGILNAGTRKARVQARYTSPLPEQYFTQIFFRP